MGVDHEMVDQGVPPTPPAGMMATTMSTPTWGAMWRQGPIQGIDGCAGSEGSVAGWGRLAIRRTLPT